MMQPDDHQIASRSYAIWEKEGKPHGKDVEHWLRARTELESEAAAATNGGKPKRTRAPAAKKSNGAAKTKKPKTAKAV